MPSGGVILICAAGAILWYGGLGVAHGVKKVSHVIKCHVVHGHKGCPPKADDVKTSH